MKKFLLAVAAVVALAVSSSFTNSALAHGPSHGHHGSHHNHGHHNHGHHGHHHHGHYHGGGQIILRPSYGYGGYAPAYGYGYPGSYYGNRGVIQIYGPRGGFTFGY